MNKLITILETLKQKGLLDYVQREKYIQVLFKYQITKDVNADNEFNAKIEEIASILEDNKENTMLMIYYPIVYKVIHPKEK